MAENQTQVQEVTNLYFEILQHLNMSTTPEWLQLDLTFQQMKVLHILKHNGTLKMKELHEKLGVSMPTITGIVNRLIERKDGVPLLARETSPEDRREVWARLTPAGVETTEMLNELNAKLVEKAIARLNDHDLSTVKSSLQTFLNVVIDQRRDMGENVNVRPSQERPPRIKRPYNRHVSITTVSSDGNGHNGSRRFDTLSTQAVAQK